MSVRLSKSYRCSPVRLVRASRQLLPPLKASLALSREARVHANFSFSRTFFFSPRAHDAYGGAAEGETQQVGGGRQGREGEGSIKLDAPVPEELATVSGSSQAFFFKPTVRTGKLVWAAARGYMMRLNTA